MGILTSCNQKSEPVPTANGTYTGTYNGYIQPTFFEGNCTAELLEEDLNLTGKIQFSNSGSSLNYIDITTQIQGNTISGLATHPSINVGTITCVGTISDDRENIDLSVLTSPPYVKMEFALMKKK